MILIKKIIDLILYGNFWIALGALILTFQTNYIIGEAVSWNDLVGFVFFATWLLYSLHRIVGILRLKEFLDVERYSVIARFRHHIIIYAFIAGIGTIWYFFQLSINVQIAVVLPGIFSLAYVFPLFGKERRLRDFNQIKIYLVAFVWAWVTVVLPIVEAGNVFSWSLFAMFIERALFIFAITLPFDIRDISVDDHSEVSTIPVIIGVEKTRRLALLLLTFGLALLILNGYLGLYNTGVLMGLIISFLLTAWFIHLSSENRHDYFYSGLMDGTMVVQGLIVYLCTLLII